MSQCSFEAHKLTDKEWPVYVEHIAVREVLLQSLSTEKLPDFSSSTFDADTRFLLSAEQRRRILLAILREAWDFQNTPSIPFDSDFDLTAADARKMKVAKLRTELEKRGLASSGLKKVLLTRLLATLPSAS